MALDPRVFINSSVVTCKLTAFSIRWGRGTSSEKMSPARATIELLDLQDNYGPALREELIGSRLEIWEKEKINRRIFYGYIRDIEVDVNSRYKRLTITATDPIVGLQSMECQPPTSVTPIKTHYQGINGILGHYFTGVESLEKGESFGGHELYPFSEGPHDTTLLEWIETVLESRFYSTWTYDPHSRKMHTIQSSSESYEHRWEERDSDCYGIRPYNGAHPHISIDGSKVRKIGTIHNGVEHTCNTVLVEYINNGDWDVVHNSDAPSSGRRDMRFKTYLTSNIMAYVQRAKTLVDDQVNQVQLPSLELRVDEDTPSDMTSWILATYQLETLVLLTRNTVHEWLYPEPDVHHPPVVRALGGVLTYQDGQYRHQLTTEYVNQRSNIQDPPITWENIRQSSHAQLFWGSAPSSSRSTVDPSVGWRDIALLPKNRGELP